ncbi:hypothetical protein HHI36_008940 [Cryptolaemus montrouzieri]|uniref:Ubiquitin-like modifier-activating enzyme ATG7 n=1 Tax=Cryptolaemus montrouzieri TaxID=559131 RepID=A0ABD2MTU3_9CUCU
MSSSKLEFLPISSSIDPSFWNKLYEIKLNVDKLNETHHSIWGYFSNINNKSNVPLLEVNSTSFNKDFESQKIYIPFHGKVLNWRSPRKTITVEFIFILSFADLKKFNFYYWFAFPVPYNLSITCNSVKNISDDFNINQLEEFWDKYCELDKFQKPYFLLQIKDELVNIFPLKSQVANLDENNHVDYYFGFYDLSLLENCPGSLLRNYITFILHHCPFLQGRSVNFLSLRLKRNSDSNLSLLNSLIFKLELPSCLPSISKLINEDPQKGWVGWEKNERGKMGPRLSNMKSFMDPKELAESSVDLNLKLMKWRLLSNIDLEKIKQTKFLLLGSGTLGCSVARIILGWGARHISFVDNSTVSYSNPVRQSLFTFEDSKYAKPKSLAAADNLRNIFPGVKSSSFQLTIPMPGHSIGESMLEEVKKDVDMLVNLIQEHDIIFLLMDSRESRWLPTVLGTYFNKIVINAALGFDSYLVMRHGVRIDMEEVKVRQHTPGFKSLKGNYLGCYFCNDVTAPGNSMKDRTLDQQCTVTRPGVSAIAGALSAELAISILQHKEGAKAPAFFKIGNVVDTEKELDNQCVLGLIPHSIRGYLSTFSQVLPATERYNMCVACSDVVQNAFDQDRFNFLLKVFQNSEYLEIITGLSELTKEAENIGVWEFSDEEEIECVSYEYSKLDLSASSSVEGNKSRGEIVVEDFSYNQNKTILQDHKALIMEEIDQSGATTSKN